MKIIIVGAGRTGCALIEALAAKNYDITVIEKQKSTVDDITDRYNVNGVVGGAASQKTLQEAVNKAVVNMSTCGKGKWANSSVGTGGDA